jgi:hypothetical protein
MLNQEVTAPYLEVRGVIVLEVPLHQIVRKGIETRPVLSENKNGTRIIFFMSLII